MQLVFAQEACIPYRLEVVPGSFCLSIDKTGSKKGVAPKTSCCFGCYLFGCKYLLVTRLLAAKLEKVQHQLETEKLCLSVAASFSFANVCV